MDNRLPLELEDILSIDPGQYGILPQLNVSHKGRLSRLRNRTNQFFKEDLEIIRLIQLVNSLMEKPNEKMVKRIISGNVELLNHVFPKVVLPRRIILNATPLQLVYFAGDTQMCKVLKPFFTELYRDEEAGIKAMERQIQEKSDDVEQKKFDFQPIIQAISKNADYLDIDPVTTKWILSPTLLAEIKKFKLDFHRAQARVIDKGIHFNLEIVKDLSEIYHDVAKNQWGFDYKKCALMEDAVLAWVLRYASQNDVQAFNQGLYYLQNDENPEPFARMQKTRDGYNFYEALKKPSRDFLSLDSSWVDIIYGVADEMPSRTLCGWYGYEIGKLISIKENFKLFELTQPDHRTKPSGCITL